MFHIWFLSYLSWSAPQRTSFLVCCMNCQYLDNDAIVILITYFYQAALAIEDSKKTFRSSSQNATCPPLSTVEAFTDFLIAKRRQVQSLRISTFSFLGVIWPGIEPEFTVSLADALFTRTLIFLLLDICVFFFRNACKCKRYFVSDNLFKCSRINMKMLRWPLTLTSMASTHEIGLTMR